MKLFGLVFSWFPLLFPLYLVRFGVFGVPTTFLEVALVVMVVWAAVLWVRHRREWGGVPRSAAIVMGLFGVAAMISLLGVPDQTVAIDGTTVESARVAQGIFKGWIVAPMVYAALLFSFPKDKSFWNRSMMALLCSGLILAGWAIFQRLTGDGLTWDGRATGPFESANYLSLILGPVVIVALAGVGWAWGCSRRGAGVMMFLVVLLAGGLWLTRSYASFIAVAAGLAVYVLGNRDFSVGFKRGAVAAGIVVAVAGVWTQWDTPKFQQFLDFEGRSSSTVRLEVYEVAWAMIKEHPLAGIGLGQFEVQYALRAPVVLGQAPMEWVMLHPHNLLLAFWLNTGLLGLLAMIGLLAVVVARRPWREGYGLVGVAFLVVILTHGLFDTPFFKNDLAYLWWWGVVLAIRPLR